MVLDCGHEPSEHESITTGYGVDQQGKKHCYTCCADADKKQMRDTGQITLYLSSGKVTNWPGSLSIPVNNKRTGRHNWTGRRYDVWFYFEGKLWHGVQYGDMTQLCHCKQIKN